MGAKQSPQVARGKASWKNRSRPPAAFCGQLEDVLYQIQKAATHLSYGESYQRAEKELKDWKRTLLEEQWMDDLEGFQEAYEDRYGESPELIDDDPLSGVADYVGDLHEDEGDEQLGLDTEE